MLTVIADALRTASRQRDWDAPQHWRVQKRGPTTDRDARKAEICRKRLHFRSPW